MLHFAREMVARIYPFFRSLRMVALAFVLALPSVAGKKTPHHGPKLVVILVVDQMRTDYITNYGHTWTRGLRRLVNQGAWFTEAAYPYLNTVTCAGHATISTGTFPATHGMILNTWYDRKQRKSINCADDPLAQVVSYGRPMKGPSSSARNLRADAFADVLVSHPSYKNTRVVVFSMKARSSTTLGGRKADAVTWFETAKGLFVTSRAYSLNGVPFVRSFIEGNPVEGDFGKTWDRSLPAGDYRFVDGDPLEKPRGWTTTFPHELKGDKAEGFFFEQWRDTPFADEYLGRMAIDAVNRLKLGGKDRTDMLAVSFGTLDSAGHDFGPRSHEVQDILFRLDMTIGTLLDHLDKVVGVNNYVVALSADHGVATIPGHLQPEGADAGYALSADVLKAAETVLQKHLGPGKFVSRVVYTDIYFEPGIEEKIAASPPIEKELREALLAVPGIGWVYSGAELAGKRESADVMERAAALSHYPERSGDWTVVPKLNYYFKASDATTHGTAHWYDRQVPVIFYGYGIKPGRYSDAATPADIAPTLARILGFKMPAAEGRALTQALASPQSLAPGQSR